jgi:hypothetical protein
MKREAGSGRVEELRQGAAWFAERRRIRHQPRIRIPVELWELAVEITESHGVSRSVFGECRLAGARWWRQSEFST